ncbi:MAG: cobaltochelatase subunit CobN [Thermodesulfobacteriota bacterium]
MRSVRICCLVALLLGGTGGVWAEEIAFLISDSDTFVVQEAVNKLEIPPGLKVRVYTPQELEQSEKARSAVAKAEVIIIDVMIAELTDYLLRQADLSKKKIYAVRGSRNDGDLRKRGFIFDEEIKSFYHHLEAKNVQSLIQRVANKEFDRFILYEKVKEGPVLGVYHPEASSQFADPEQYLAWYRARPAYDPKAPVVAVMTYTMRPESGQIEHVDYVIRRLEQAGFSVMCLFGWDPEILARLVKDRDGRPYMDAIVAFSLKFQSALDEKVLETLQALDVPIFNLLNLHYSTIEQWTKDPMGIKPLEVGWAIANPEISGLIEPSVVSGKVTKTDPDSGKTVYLHKAIEENIEVLIPRIQRWISLQRMPNERKRVVILIYNNSPGKQNVGASYLNVFASLTEILSRLKSEGYRVDSEQGLTHQAIRDLILRSGRNIGNWAPGELETMLQDGNIARIPLETYAKWFSQLPEPFRQGVLDQWGAAEASEIMIKHGQIIVPGIRLGNVMIMPEPSRGYTDDPMKLYHSPTLFPHHQYVAAYLWMKHVFNADAQIHLGTHGTHEWLPGKQAGLSPACPPDVLITDIPSLYPYIVDDVGEGIQAKRRGRAAVIDHLIPAVKEGGLYQEYSKLYSLLSQYYAARSSGGETAQVRLESIAEMIRKLGVDKDLSLSDINDESLEKVQEYLVEMQGDFMPYGMHTFGISPEGEALSETVNFILKMHPDRDANDIGDRLRRCGPLELDRLVHGLNGRYVPPGTGNDPFRNPKAIPTGKNFYGFDPARVPSPAAYELGVKAAEDLIARSLERENRYPDKVAVVLWATETIRNEGINEATILHLLGMKPKWDNSDRVEDVVPIPGAQLKRPRIDVLIDASGLYRDLFPNMLQYLDKAVQKAVVLTDVENLIHKNSDQIKNSLMQSGISEKDATSMSRLRVFSEKPGNYGNRVTEIVSASGLWQKDDDVAKAFEKYTGYAFGQDVWGAEAQEVFRTNLKQSDMAVHSISSTVFGTMDNDDMFQYLGGLSLAIAKQSGKTPDTVVSLQRRPNEVKVESLSKTVGQELRTRYLNPKWIDGMKKEDYAGAREMSNFVEYMWGWQVTTPFAVDEAKWKQTFEVYVEDKYGLQLREFFDGANPWAYQSLTARMLESIRKDYWKPEDAVKQKLATEYALNVVEKGIACCDHTCNNPALNQMVVNIVSIPGVMSPELVEQFKLAVEKATKKSLDQQAEEMKQTQQMLAQGFEKQSQLQKPKEQEKSAEDQKKETVDGYKMEEMDSRDDVSKLPSSGAQWYALVVVVVLLMLVGIGVVLKSRRQ